MTDVFPFAPNRRGRPYTVRRSWRTETITSRAGREQRIARRSQPRKEVEFPVTVTRECRRAFGRWMTRAQRQAVLIHERPIYVTLAAGMAAAADSVDLGAAPPAWIADAAQLMLVHQDRLEARSVASVAGNIVTFVETGSDAWPGGTRLHPALQCRLDAEISAELVRL